MSSSDEFDMIDPLADLYVEVPNVVSLDTHVPIDVVSGSELIDAFGEACAVDFSFEGILGLGALSHVAEQVTQEEPSPTTRDSLPSFTFDTTEPISAVSPVKAVPPRFSTVETIRSPLSSVVTSIHLKSRVMEHNCYTSISQEAGRFLDLPVTQQEMFNQVNALLAGKAKKPPRKKRQPQQTILEFQQRKAVANKAAANKAVANTAPVDGKAPSQMPRFNASLVFS